VWARRSIDGRFAIILETSVAEIFESSERLRMLNFVSKAEYWAAEDAGMLSITRFDPSHFQIKNIQDAIVIYRLNGLSGKEILEAGGSRVLDYIFPTNRCVNINPLEGFHGGPQGRRYDKVQRYEQIYGEIGKSSGVLADKSFDVVF
jgi:hypothetical protein